MGDGRRVTGVACAEQSSVQCKFVSEEMEKEAKKYKKINNIRVLRSRSSMRCVRVVAVHLCSPSGLVRLVRLVHTLTIFKNKATKHVKTSVAYIRRHRQAVPLPRVKSSIIHTRSYART